MHLRLLLRLEVRVNRADRKFNWSMVGKVDHKLVGSMSLLNLPGNPVDEVISALAARRVEVRFVLVVVSHISLTGCRVDWKEASSREPC